MPFFGAPGNTLAQINYRDQCKTAQWLVLQSEAVLIHPGLLTIQSPPVRTATLSPAKSAPRAIALATSIPFRSPPEAIKGIVESTRRIVLMHSAVGSPQSAKVLPKRLCKGLTARSLSTFAQDVPPAPATSMALTPASISLWAL